MSAPPVDRRTEEGTERLCHRCGQWRALDAAHFVRNRPDRADGRGRHVGYHATCKACESEAKRAGWERRRADAAAYEAWKAAKEGPR